MNQTAWFGEKNVVAGLLAGFFGGKKRTHCEINDSIFI
jgi:hypothetical protein